MPKRIESGVNFDSDQILCLLLEYIDDFETLYCMALLSQDLHDSLNQISSFSLGVRRTKNRCRDPRQSLHVICDLEGTEGPYPNE